MLYISLDEFAYMFELPLGICKAYHSGQTDIHIKIENHLK